MVKSSEATYWIVPFRMWSVYYVLLFCVELLQLLCFITFLLSLPCTFQSVLAQTNPLALQRKAFRLSSASSIPDQHKEVLKC